MGDIEKSHIDMDIDMSQKRYRYIDIAWSRSRYISNIAIIFCYMKTVKIYILYDNNKKTLILSKGFWLITGRNLVGPMKISLNKQPLWLVFEKYRF